MVWHPRRALQDLVDGELSDRRRMAVERHVSRCSSCSASLLRLRRLKSALLGLRNPAPDPAFQLRLLTPGFDAPSAAREVRPGSGAASAGHHERTGHRRRRGAAIAATGGFAVVVTTVLASAYVLGSEERPATPDAATGVAALRAGWDSVAPQTPALLGAEQLETLRERGWYCPELESLGFTLRSAEGITVGGRPTLELVLENDGDTVTVYEQRKLGDIGTVGTPPMNAATGNTVASDGFDHVGGVERDVWVRSGESWQVVLDSPSVTYTVVSDLPAASMPQTLSQLVMTEHAQLSMTPLEGDASMAERILRGLSRIVHPQEEHEQSLRR